MDQPIQHTATDTVALIKAEALRLGFSACGIARAQAVPTDVRDQYEQWIAHGYHGVMRYMEENKELRYDPQLLLPGTRSLIVVAMNYYPDRQQPEGMPRFARYAHGRDYHKVVKKRLDQLLLYIQKEICSDAVGRSFSDSAPILERYWAEQAGIGWRGKNSLLIIPKAGSYFVLGELLISIELESDSPMPSKCGPCTLCLRHCPTEAIVADGVIEARRCISYLTIEQKDEIPPELALRMGKRLYGCDACQECCPWNRLARPTTVSDFYTREHLLSLTPEAIETMTPERYMELFAGSAIRRAGLDGLQRNMRSIRQHFPDRLGSLMPEDDQELTNKG